MSNDNRLVPIIRKMVERGHGSSWVLQNGLMLGHVRTGPFCALVIGRLAGKAPSTSECKTVAAAICQAWGNRPVAVSKFPEEKYMWPGRGEAIVHRVYWQLEPVVVYGLEPAAEQKEIF